MYYSVYISFECLIKSKIILDDFRNDFYVTVIGGDFQKARNYEFVVNLVQFRDEGSKLVEVC